MFKVNNKDIGIFILNFEHVIGNVHQGCALNPLVFIKFRIGSPWQLLYAHDLAIVSGSKYMIQEKLCLW